MRIILLLPILLLIGCGEKHQETKASLPVVNPHLQINTAPKQIIHPKIGDCISLPGAGDPLKITAQGKYSFSFAKYKKNNYYFDYEDMSSLPIIDVLNKGSIISCPESLSFKEQKELKEAHNNYLKNKKVNSNSSFFKIGTCIHIQSNVYKITANKRNFYTIIYSEVVHKNKNYLIVTDELLKDQGALSDCREDLYALHKKSNL